MNKNELLEPVARTVGYMLKVLRNGIQITEFNSEFKMIRHGNYFEFINRIKGEVPFTVVWNKGVITSGNTPKENDVDFLSLHNAGPSLIKFYNLCSDKYGNIHDPDIPNEIYGLAALFELNVRMHANNHHLIESREKLIAVIDKLANFKKLTSEEINKLHQSRRFINMIKHFNNQFPSWNEGIIALKAGYNVLKENQLRIA